MRVYMYVCCVCVVCVRTHTRRDASIDIEMYTSQHMRICCPTRMTDHHRLSRPAL